MQGRPLANDLVVPEARLFEEDPEPGGTRQETMVAGTECLHHLHVSGRDHLGGRRRQHEAPTVCEEVTDL